MAEPPKKRARRTDSAAMWEKEQATPSPRSPPPHDSKKADKGKSRRDDDRRKDHASRRDEDHRRRSRSPRDRKDRSRRERSRSRDRSYRDRDRDHERDKDRGKDRRNGDIRRDRDKDSKDLPSSKKDKLARRSRSRSPIRNGDTKSEQVRSPPRGPRTDHDRQRGKDRDKPAIKAEPQDAKKKVKPEPERKPEVKPTVNGDAMALDEDEEDARLRQMMGFVAFNTTHNKKVPGNQIYGVRKEKKTEYRQYMNRVGGFNRPLSPSRG